MPKRCDLINSPLNQGHVGADLSLQHGPGVWCSQIDDSVYDSFRLRTKAVCLQNIDIVLIIKPTEKRHKRGELSGLRKNHIGNSRNQASHTVPDKEKLLFLASIVESRIS